MDGRAGRGRGHGDQRDRLARHPVTVTVTPRPLGQAISRGQPVAGATVTAGSQVSKITLDGSQAAQAPSIRWRLTRL